MVYTNNTYKWPVNLGVGRPYRMEESTKDFNQCIELTRNKKMIDWAKLMISGKKSEAVAVMKSLSEEGEGTPWNSAGTDADLRLINEIVLKIQ